MRVGLVVVNYGSSELLETAILPLAEIPDVLPVVVDNFLDQDEQDAVASLGGRHGWTSLLLETNTGFGHASNAGGKEAAALGCDVLVFLNPDAAITAENFVRLTSALDRHPAEVVAPVIRRPDGTVWFDGGALDLRIGKAFHRAPGAGAPDWLTGACLAMTSQTFAQLEGFREEYFLYWEDVDLTYRWKARGGVLRVATECEAVHLVGATQGSGGKSRLYLYHNMRNRLWFGRQHFGIAVRLRWLLGSPGYVVHLARVAGVRRGRTRVGTFLSGVMHGFVDGLRPIPAAPGT